LINEIRSRIGGNQELASEIESIIMKHKIEGTNPKRPSKVQLKACQSTKNMAQSPNFFSFDMHSPHRIQNVQC